MDAPCRIEMLGGLQLAYAARVGEEPRVVSRFATRKTASLLAYLACHLKQPAHPRELLADMLWPEARTEAGHASLRAALASLRRQLEPPGVLSGSVLIADRFAVRLNPLTVATDTAEFEAALKALAPINKTFLTDAFFLRDKTAGEARLDRLTRAVALYRGDLLPGFYEAWILGERERLRNHYLAALREIATLARHMRDWNCALENARKWVAANRLDEEAQQALIRALADAGNTEAALQQYARMEQLWQEEFNDRPDAITRRLVESIRQPQQHGGNGSVHDDSPALSEPVPIMPSIPLPSQEGEFLPAREAKPPVAARHSPPARLPLTLTRFFGREIELARLLHWLQGAEENRRVRLVTLTGQGGAGKTRLAIETARQLSALPHLLVVFVPLADVVAPNLIVSEIANALRPAGAQNTDGSETEQWEQITFALAGWENAVLILDNFEQLSTPEGARIAQTLLARVPNLSCLVTSRQPLLVEGEREFPLLPLPTPEYPDTPEHLLYFASVQMFLDRAQAARPDFQITRGNARSVALLCRKLEGLPLALELAASWAQTLSPAQMLLRVERPLDLLVSRHHTRIPRHQSLRAALTGSYELLTPALQTVFARLAVFRGGWTLEAAEAVCELPETLVALTKLRECSLVIAEDSADESGEMRFRMAETVREYAWEQLSAKEQKGMADRHSDYFVALAETIEPQLRREGVSQWLLRLEAEQENMRWILARAENHPEAALRLAGALGRFWYLRGYWSEGRDWLYRMLEHTRVSLPSRARALLAAATLAWTQDVYGEAERLCEESLEAHRNLDDKRGIAASLSLTGMLAVLKGDTERGQGLLEESISLFREAGDRWGIAHTLDRLSYAVRDAGDYAQAEALDRQCLSLRRELSDTHGVAVSISNLADLAFLRGEWDDAAALHAESLEGFRAIQDTNGVAYALGKLGMVALRQGNIARAEELERESVALFWEMRDRRRMAGCLETFANIRHAQNRHTEATQLFSAANALRESIAAPLTAAERVDWERSAAAMQAALGASSFARAWTQGQILSLEQAVTSVLQIQEES